MTRAKVISNQYKPMTYEQKLEFSEQACKRFQKAKGKARLNQAAKILEAYRQGNYIPATHRNKETITMKRG